MKLDPHTLRDFRQGRVSDIVSPSLVPENSVANSLNVNFDDIIGSAVVRSGTTPLGLAPLAGVYAQQENQTIDNGGTLTYDTNFSAQTFLAATSYVLSAIRLKLYGEGIVTGLNATVYLVDTTAGVPNFAQKFSQSALIPVGSISSGAPGSDYIIPMSQYQIVAGHTYAIVLRLFNGDITNNIVWRRDNGASYPGGTGYTSTNSGSTWSVTLYDFNFSLYSITPTTGQTPLGLTQFFSTQVSQINDIVAIININNYLAGNSILGSGGILFYWNGTKWAPGYYNVATSVKTRFATLGGYLFLTNSVDGMLATNDPSNTPVTTNCITTDSVKPSLIFRSKNRLLASGYNGFTSRVYFSSIISPNSSPFITWNTDPTIGDWIDINPDDGGYVTGFTETPASALVFKSNGFYRLDAINKTVTPNPVSPIGAVSQEAITNCQGLAYFFDGTGIWSSNGDVPLLISRLGVKDFINAIPQANWSNVALGSDDYTVRVSIGDVTLNANQDGERTYQNVQLRFSVLDQSWSVHSYGYEDHFFTDYLASTGKILVGLDVSAYVQQLDDGMTDNGIAINYELETQDLEFTDRSHTKEISNKIVAFTKNGQDGTLQINSNGGDFKPVEINLNDRVNIGSIAKMVGNFFRFRWLGQSKGKPPILQGIDVIDITDKGVVIK